MLLSYFTPTHNPKFIGETYRSLLRQSKDIPFEFVVVPNGGIRQEDLPRELIHDSRVRIVSSELTGIGALKRFACEQCHGDVLVELDHDDTMASSFALELVRAYESTPGAFYYSDFVNARPNGSCETYNRKHGWLNYVCTIDGKKYTACRSFEPTARSLCHIYYAPNHVRAWSRKAYTLSGGHDPSMTIADDHDLVCRTYLSGVPFVWLKKPLYIYRRHSANTFTTMIPEIRQKQYDVADIYLHGLVAEECQRNGHEVLTLTADVDLNSIQLNRIYGCIIANDVLHRVHQYKLAELFNKLHEALHPGGWLLTATPIIKNTTSLHEWSEESFDLFSRYADSKRLSGYKGRFQCVRRWTTYPSEWHRHHEMPYVYCDMAALKGQRQPGLCEI